MFINADDAAMDVNTNNMTSRMHFTRIQITWEFIVHSPMSDRVGNPSKKLNDAEKKELLNSRIRFARDILTAISFDESDLK